MLNLYRLGVVALFALLLIIIGWGAIVITHASMHIH
jgi:hypothetical protein